MQIAPKPTFINTPFQDIVQIKDLTENGRWGISLQDCFHGLIVEQVVKKCPSDELNTWVWPHGLLLDLLGPVIMRF